MLQRLRLLLAALWGGQLLCVATLAAPNAFAVLERSEAGRYVGRLFELDASVSLGLALLLVLMERRVQRDAADEGRVLTAALVLPLAALFCTVAGFYALQPMLAAARLGEGGLSFASLHLISTSFYALKLVLVLALAWMLSRMRSS